MFLKTDFTSELVVGQNLGKSKKNLIFSKKVENLKIRNIQVSGLKSWKFFVNWFIGAKQTFSASKSSNECPEGWKIIIIVHLQEWVIVLCVLMTSHNRIFTDFNLGLYETHINQMNSTQLECV